MLNQFAPYVDKGDIANLPKYNFYIKISAVEPEEPFSGKTLYIPLKKDIKKIEKLIETSRNNWATEYKKAEDKADNKLDEDSEPETLSKAKKTISKGGFPESGLI